MAGIIKGPTKEARAEALAQMISAFQILEEAFEPCSKGKNFFGGDTIGLVDIVLGCFLGWIKVIEEVDGVKLLHAEKIPRLTTWAERFCSHSAVKEVMPETEKLIEFTKTWFKRDTI